MARIRGSTDTMRGLSVFISDIRNSKSREAEIKRINKELANIRSKFKGGLLRNLCHNRQITKFFRISLPSGRTYIRSSKSRAIIENSFATTHHLLREFPSFHLISARWYLLISSWRLGIIFRSASSMLLNWLSCSWTRFRCQVSTVSHPENFDVSNY